ncbi:hypothetical protein [Tessaracoccus rhinocerotis]|uniref:hypothetical protein n=1 Tax=Tessaracoccus rhinocerotis TaxID=1689449 RepID=UPI00117FB2EB|nr:hypothetical protein [Tessaracoccus rhinocerotis]
MTRGMGSGSSSAVASIEACSFQLDVQWILDIIDKVQNMIGKVKTFCHQVLDKAERILDKLSGILTWFCWMPAGKFAKAVVDNACRVLRRAVDTIATIYDRIYEAMKHVLAPWEVRSAGEQLRDQLAPKCADFAMTLHPGNLKSAGSTWTGPAAEMFSSKMDRQYNHANDVAEAVKKFGQAVQKIGADGVTTTVTFITSLVTAIGGIIIAIVEMAAVPVGTAIGAAQVLALVAAIFTYIMVYVKAMMGIIAQVSEMNNAASSVPGSQWPRAAI